MVLASKFETTDLGPCSFYLGVKIICKKGSTFLSQNSFTELSIGLAGFKNAKPAATPLPISHPLYKKRVSVSDEEEGEMDRI